MLLLERDGTLQRIDGPGWYGRTDRAKMTPWANGQTLPAGPAPASTAQAGVLAKIRDLSLPLMAMLRTDVPGGAVATAGVGHPAQRYRRKEP